MTLIQFFRVLNRNFNVLFLCSLALAVSVFFFTRNLPKTYESNTEIYTGIASGMNIESVGGMRLDYNAMNNEYANLINVITSKQTAGEVGERLLVQHLMLDNYDENVITEEGWEAFNSRVPKELQDSLTVPGSEQQTLENVRHFKRTKYGEYRANQIFDHPNSPYSYQAISHIRVERVGSSDIIKISYAWSDPGICQNTLEFLNQVFSDRLLDMKVDRSADVVTYFQEKVDEAKMDLENAESALVDFRIENKIIDYGEQTRSVASSQKDIERQYQEEQQIQAAARAKVSKLDQQLALSKDRVKFSTELLTKRRELADLKSRILELEVYYNDSKKVDKLQAEADKLEAEISGSLSKLYEMSRTKDGVSSESLLNEWLTATLTLDESTARLRVLSNNKNFFENVYDDLSPLGAELTRMQRAVDVAEKRYLELTNSLNWVLMRQQSETIATSGITVTSPPVYPLQPVESKQLLLVLLAAVVGFLIPLVFVLLLEFLDHTVKSPIRGEEQTGLKIMGAYPDVNPSVDFKHVNMDWLKNKAIGLISQNLRLDARKLEKAGLGPKYVLLFSTREDDGKSFIMELIARELKSIHKKVLIISPDLGTSEEDRLEVYNYSNDKAFLETRSLEDLVPPHLNKNEYDFVFLELNGILSNQYPIELVEKFDMAICVLSAKRIWNKADKYALAEFIDTMGFEPRLLVNGVSPDFMDQVLGDIQKSRSALHRFFKGLLTMQFSSKELKGNETRKVTPATDQA